MLGIEPVSAAMRCPAVSPMIFIPGWDFPQEVYREAMQWRRYCGIRGVAAASGSGVVGSAPGSVAGPGSNTTGAKFDNGVPDISGQHGDTLNCHRTKAGQVRLATNHCIATIYTLYLYLTLYTCHYSHHTLSQLISTRQGYFANLPRCAHKTQKMIHHRHSPPFNLPLTDGTKSPRYSTTSPSS